MAIKVTPMAEADIPGAVAAIQEAFAEDPYTHWMFDMSNYNAQRNASSLGIRCRWGIRNGLFQVAKEQGSDDVLGVAMWLKPEPVGQPTSWNDWFEGWRLWFNQLGMNLWYGRGGLNVKVLKSLPYISEKSPLLTHVLQRYYIWKNAQEVAHSSVWRNPRGYYFLNIMVVLPKAQGKGVGRAMMKAVTDKADAENMPCYLESSREKPNMDIYARFGFKFTKELLCDDDGAAITLYTMVREPNSGLL